MAEVRAVTPQDAAGLADVYAPYVLGSVATFEDVPPDAAEMARRAGAGLPWRVAVEGGEVVGYAGAAPHRSRAAYRWTVETSVYLAPRACGRGLGTALYASLLPELRGLGHVTALAGVTLPNPASVALHEAVGFRPVARFPHVGFKSGAWHDVGWWSLALVDPLPVPPPPR